MSDDLTKAAPAVVQQRLVLPCPACGASPAPEPASVCWWCGASLNGKMRKLKRVAEAESINAGEPPPKHFGGIGGHLRTSWDAEYSVLQVQELRECIRKCIESKVRFHYRLRYGIFAQLMQCFHQALAALRKFCGGNQIPHNAQASDVHNKRNSATAPKR